MIRNALRRQSATFLLVTETFSDVKRDQDDPLPFLLFASYRITPQFRPSGK